MEEIYTYIHTYQQPTNFEARQGEKPGGGGEDEEEEGKIEVFKQEITRRGAILPTSFVATGPTCY